MLQYPNQFLWNFVPGSGFEPPVVYVGAEIPYAKRLSCEYRRSTSLNNHVNNLVSGLRAFTIIDYAVTGDNVHFDLNLFGSGIRAEIGIENALAGSRKPSLIIQTPVNYANYSCVVTALMAFGSKRNVSPNNFVYIAASDALNPLVPVTFGWSSNISDGVHLLGTSVINVVGPK